MCFGHEGLEKETAWQVCVCARQLRAQMENVQIQMATLLGGGGMDLGAVSDFGPERRKEMQIVSLVRLAGVKWRVLLRLLRGEKEEISLANSSREQPVSLPLVVTLASRDSY